MENKHIKPFIKWVGGKRQLIKKIDIELPEKFNNYHEPFVGGGAVFFHMLKNGHIKKNAYLNDLNDRLITTYEVVRDNPKKLMKNLDEYREKSNEEFYKEERKKIEGYKTDLKIASWFIYTNKAGFNGLYRVNSNGGFNVPYGKDDDKKLYEAESIIETSKAMNEIDLKVTSGSFENAFKNIKKGDFVFIDPPYDYEPDVKDGFTRYVNPDFKRELQDKLYDEIKKIHDKGAFFLKTNHSTKYINDKYKEFNIQEVDATRLLNSDASKRKNKVKEVFIKNY